MVISLACLELYFSTEEIAFALNLPSLRLFANHPGLFTLLGLGSQFQKGFDLSLRGGSFLALEILLGVLLRLIWLLATFAHLR